MQNISPTPTFQRGVVQPMVCLRAGYDLVKDQYWLFVGMCALAILIGSAVPFGILMGPMMCGLYMAIFRKYRGQPVEFGILFKGFDYLGESIIATLIHVIPIVVIIVPFYIAFYAALFFMIPRSGDPPPSMIVFFAVFFVFLIIVMVLVIVISVLFTFTYPLIVDRHLKGIDAVRLSVKAGLANFWSLLGLLLLTGLLGFCGVLLCYVGMFLVFPVTFSAMAMAYEQVFGISGSGEAPAVPAPPPPPTFT